MRIKKRCCLFKKSICVIIVVGHALTNCASHKKHDLINPERSSATEIRAGTIAYVAGRQGLNLKDKPNQKSKTLHHILWGEQVSVAYAGPWERIDGVDSHWFSIQYGEWQGWTTDKELTLVRPETELSRFRTDSGCYLLDAKTIASAFRLGCFGSCGNCGELQIRLYNEGKAAFHYGCHYGGHWQGRWFFQDGKILISGVYLASGAQFYYDDCAGLSDMSACTVAADKKFRRLYGHSSIAYRMSGAIYINSDGEGILNLSAKEIYSNRKAQRKAAPFTHQNENIGCIKDIQ